MSTLVQQVFQGNVVNNTMELTKDGQCYQNQGCGAGLFLGHLEPEPSVQMANALEQVRQNPVQVAAGPDNRCDVLHPARFLGGAVCNSAELFQKAREVLGPGGVTPLANFDTGVFGLPGCVTMRGWKEIQNPGSSHLTLKLFSPNNLHSSTGSTRRLTLADTDGGINVGEHLKEITDLEELKLAMRALCMASLLATPWNHSFFAVDGGLHLINYGAHELAGFPNRAETLVKFINHIFELNAIAWTQKKPFLTAAEIRIKFPEWLACSTVSLLKPVDQPQQQQQKQQQQSNKQQKQRFGNRQQNSYQGGLPAGQNPGPKQTQQTTTQQQPQPLMGAQAQNIQYCRRYNITNSCPNHFSNCVVPNTTHKLMHLCDVVKQNGQVCGGKHPRIQHH